MLFGLSVLNESFMVAVAMNNFIKSSRLVEVHRYVLSSDIAIVFHVHGNRVFFYIVLLVGDVVILPLHSLYCADYVFR